MRPYFLRYSETTFAFLALPLFFCLICPIRGAMAMENMKTSQTCSAARSDSNTTSGKPIQDCNQRQTLALSKAAPGDLKPIPLPLEVLTYHALPDKRGPHFAFLAGLTALQQSRPRDLYLLNRSLLL